MKSRNIITCALMLVVLFGGIMYKIADKIELLPAGLDNGSYSYLEGGALQKLPEFSLDRITSGIFQDEVEAYVSACFPSRDRALLANAAAQRSVIELAALPFSFTCFPTQFGGTKLYDRVSSGLFELPATSDRSTMGNLEEFAASVTAMHDSNPGCNVVVFVPDCTRVTEANPSSELVHNSLSHADLLEYLSNAIDPDVEVTHFESKDSDEFFELFYKTDHHWTIDGAYRAYQTIAQVLGLETISPLSRVSYDGYPSYGSIARQGLYLTADDHISDFVFPDFDGTVIVNGEIKPRDGKTSFADGSVDEGLAVFRSYESYFGMNYSVVQYANNSSKNDRNLLIVGDSFTQPVEPMLAASYKNTFSIDPRSNYYTDSLSAFIDENDIDDIVVIMRITTMVEDGVAEEIAS